MNQKRSMPVASHAAGTLGLRAMHLSEKIVFDVDRIRSLMSSPMRIFRNSASETRCLIMSGVSASSVVRSTPLYSILIVNCAEGVLCASACSLDGVPASARPPHISTLKGQPPPVATEPHEYDQGARPDERSGPDRA